MPGINPEILQWARLTAGYDLPEAARKIGLNAARGKSGEDRLAELEAGTGEPSEALLERMAKQYRRPLLTFYLPVPPRPDDIGQDFRTLPERGDESNVVLAALLRDIKARQALTREVLEDDDDAEPVPFIGSARQAHGVTQVAHQLTQDIGFDRQRFRAARTAEDAFAYLRGQVERAGVFVVLAGSLGSWQTAIDVKVFRGFAIADPLAPFIVINDQDAKAAWPFTLLHELAHLWIGESGISGGNPSHRTERFCNDVAAAILVDDVEIDALPIPFGLTRDELIGAVEAFADGRRVSRTMVLYQLFRRDRIDEATWRDLRQHFHGKWIEGREAQRRAGREQDGGPNWYVVRRHRVGAALLDVVRRGMQEGGVTPTRAGKILGVKPMNVYGLVNGPARAERAA